MTGEMICNAAAFAAEALTAWLYMEYLFKAKRSPMCLASTFLTGYAVMFLVFLLGNTTANALCFCGVNFLLAIFNYQCGPRPALLHTAFLCFIMVGAELLVNLLIVMQGFEFSAFTYDFTAMMILAVLSKLLYLVFSVIGSRIFSRRKNFNEEPRLMILFCSIPVLSAAIAILIAYLGMTAGMSGTVGLMTTVIVVALMVVNLILLALYNHLQKTNENYLTLQLSLQKEQADAAYYTALQEQYENQRILVHDIKKHLSTIDAIAKQSGSVEIENYVASLDAAFASSSQAKLCADPILNLVLLRFREDCKKQGVSLHCDVRENVSEFMDATSITALYGNLLSNSLEASTQSQEKQIELSVTRNADQSVILVSVVNTCDTAPAADNNGGFFTRKADRISHGIGLKSIDRVVKKYNGVSTMYYDPEKKQFHHIIQFPVPL